MLQRNRDDKGHDDRYIRSVYDVRLRVLEVQGDSWDPKPLSKTLNPKPSILNPKP